MIVWSVSDLRRISVFSEMSELEFVSIENDDLVAKYLYKLGIDTDYPFLYTANYHRNLNNEIVLGFRVCGETRCDAEFKDSWMASITDRMVISSYLDVTLMEDIAELSFKVRDFSEYLNDNDSIEFDESRAITPYDQLEPDWEQREENVKVLEEVLLSIRGPVYNAAGAIKSMAEYKEFAETRELYQEKYGE